MIFLVGGPPRIGKSIITREIQQKHAVSVVSTDTICAVLERVLSSETVPDLFVFETLYALPMTERVTFINKDPTALIAYVRKESAVVWNAVEAFVRREHEERRDVLIEGVAVLPELVSQLEHIPHRVVFLGNQSEHHHKNITQSIREHPHDWMQNMSDEYIDAFALFVRRMSAYVEQEANTYGFTYIAMETMRFENVADAVMSALELRAQ